MVTMTGCLYNEDDVPGRTPNVAEKAGVLEDYILADARLSHATAADHSRTGALPGASTSIHGATAGTMYKVEGMPDEQLRTLVGKRVEVMGRIDAEGKTTSARADRNPISPDKIDLPEFEASSVRAVSGGAACATTPAQAPVTPR